MSGAALIRRERFGNVKAEVCGLMLAHQKEVGDLLASREPAIDFTLMEKLELMGALHMTTGRVDGKVVGYIIWMLSDTNLEYEGVATAQQGPWYVDPGHRESSLGLGLFRASLRELRDRGFKLAEPHHFATAGGEKLGRWFRSLGAKEVQTSYLLDLDEAKIGSRGG